MRLEQPEVMRIGAAMMIVPGSGRLPADIQADLATMILLEPEPALLAKWISRVESKLSVDDSHRQALADRAVAAVESVADRRRRRLEEHRRAAQLRAPMRDQDLVAKIESKTAEAEALRAKAAQLRDADRKKNRKAAKELESRARGLDQQVAELREEERTVESWGEAKEPILWRRQQGEDLEVRTAETAEVARDEYGARIVHSDGDMAGLPSLIYSTAIRAKRLTGPEHAIVEGHLSGAGVAAERLYRTAIDYRDAYEIAEGQAGNAGEGGGGGGPKAPQPRLVEAGQTLADMRRQLNPRQRQVLDLVCGKDLRLREAAAQMGAGFPATKRALCTGLVTAAASVAIARQTRQEMGVMPVGLRVQLVRQALRRVHS